MKDTHGGNVHRYKDVIDFSANINPLGMPSSVREAAMRGVLSSEVYPDPESEHLTDLIAEMEGLAPEQVICGNGAAELIFLLCRAAEPKAAALFQPSFAEYAKALTACGSAVVSIPLREKDGFKITEETLAEVKSRMQPVGKHPVSMVFLCQPNNPTGQLTTPDKVRALLEICQKQEAILVIDACFTDLLSEEAAAIQQALLRECLAYEKTVVVKAFTKAFAMPGLRLGYLISNDSGLIRKMKGLTQPWNVSLPAQMAGEAALLEQAFLQKSRSFLETEKTWLLQALSLERVVHKVYGHEANFIFFKAAAGLWQRMLERGILIRDCSNYTGLEEGYYRIAVRTHEENLALLKALGEEV